MANGPPGDKGARGGGSGRRMVSSGRVTERRWVVGEMSGGRG